MSNSKLETSTSASSATNCTAPLDYYAVLGIKKDATKTDIKKAYGKLAWKWHPLKNLAYQFDANVTFKKIAEAYEILSDGVLRQQYDANLIDGMPFSPQDFDLANPYDVFEDFKSFEGLTLGDDSDIEISSASEVEEDAMSIGSGTDYSRTDNKNSPVVTIEYSVTRSVAGDTTVKTDSTSSVAGSQLTTSLSADDSNPDDDGKDDDESLKTKTVHLSTETKPDGRTYMTKKLSENGVETLNVVREGDITDTDIADAERFVEW